MDSPVVELRFKGRLVQTLLFQGDVLRIGRMKENDVVISNASVSRFHAVLKRENGQVILEDSGSENGCYVNGVRVSGSVTLSPGDEVQIGKHQLTLAEAGEGQPLPSEVVRPEKSDAWDASNTYFVGVDTQAKMLQGSGSEPEEEEEEDDPLLPAESEAITEEEAGGQEPAALAEDAEVVAESPPIGEGTPEPMEVAEDEVEAWTPASVEAADGGEPEQDLPSADAEESGDESPFAFDIDTDLVSPEPGGKLEVDPQEYDVELSDEEPEQACEKAPLAEEPPAPEPESGEEPTWYAGLIIQHQGKLERIISWDEDRLAAGRSGECEIHLDQVEISRRHAMFVREEGRYQVRDLDSINGIFVNGEKVRRRDLQVGDVVKIEDFELTFLLDRQPIASEIVTDDRSAPREAVAEDRFDMTVIGEALPIGSAGAAPEPLEEVPEMLEGSLFGPDDDEKEDLVEVEELSIAPPEAAPPEAPVATDEVVSFELRVRLQDLPLPLRTALAEVEERDLRLPVELVFKSRTGDSSEG